MPRPTKLTEQVITDIQRHLSMGQSISAACLQAGVSEESFYRWKRLVMAGRGNRLQRRLVRVAEETQALVQGTIESALFAAVAKDWRAGAWVLERRDRRQYALNQAGVEAGAAPVKITGARFSLWAPESETPGQAPSSSDG